MVKKSGLPNDDPARFIVEDQLEVDYGHRAIEAVAADSVTVTSASSRETESVSRCSLGSTCSKRLDARISTSVDQEEHENIRGADHYEGGESRC